MSEQSSACCRITNAGLPSGLARLPYLKSIGLKRNCLTSGPRVLGRMHSLQEIYLEDNNELEVRTYIFDCSICSFIPPLPLGFVTNMEVDSMSLCFTVCVAQQPMYMCLPGVRIECHIYFGLLLITSLKYAVAYCSVLTDSAHFAAATGCCVCCPICCCGIALWHHCAVDVAWLHFCNSD